MEDSNSYPFGVATASLGMATSATLERKFSALKAAGFSYCELGFDSYMAWVRQQNPLLPASTCPPAWSEGGEPDPSDTVIWEAMYAEAPKMISYAKTFGLTILVLQPLNQFDGWPKGSERGRWARRKAEKWLSLCSKLQVQQLQVGSNDFAEADAPDEKTAEDLRWLAELGASLNPPVKIAYESWCFSKRVNSWEHTWKIVQLADHSNLGLCLDTAHFPLAPAYGWNPLTGDGWTDQDFKSMIERIKTIPGEKIFYVELSDVLRPVVPLGQGSPFDDWRQKANSPRGDSFVWAICARPVPLVGKDGGRSVHGEDDMGGARVVEVVRAILSTGFRGPMMYEMFEALSMERDDPEIPNIYARACKTSEQLLKRAILA